VLRLSEFHMILFSVEVNCNFALMLMLVCIMDVTRSCWLDDARLLQKCR